jgi:hypothetical protein
MGKNSKSTLRGRDADTGHFTTVSEARRHPSDHTVERVPKPGRGDSGTGQSSLRGRDVNTGHFTTVSEARRNKSDHVVERVPKPGRGDTE